MKNKVLMCGVFSLLVIFCLGIFGCGSKETVVYVPATKYPGSITGTLSMVSGVVASGVAVELTQLSTSTKFSTQTDINGYYSFYDLPDGKYLLRYVKSGYVNFNIPTIVSGLHKDISGNLLTSSEITQFFGPTHPYNSQKGLVGAYVRSGRYAGLEGATVSLSPASYEGLGYQIADYSFDWTATSTILGYAMFYNVTPGNYTVTASRTGYTMSPVSYTDVPVLAGEITQVEFIPTQN
jgi:hypothetical protein